VADTSISNGHRIRSPSTSSSLPCIDQLLVRLNYETSPALAFPPAFSSGADPLFPPSSVPSGLRPFHWTGNCASGRHTTNPPGPLESFNVRYMSRGVTSILEIICGTAVHNCIARLLYWPRVRRDSVPLLHDVSIQARPHVRDIKKLKSRAPLM